ncbi:MAG: hypothetical protein R3F56_15215 [Planctomycetota bacterium]
MVGRFFYVGSSDATAAALAEALGAGVERRLPEDVQDSDTFFLQGFATEVGDLEVAKLPGGNAFSACRDIKARRRAHVFVLVQAGDVVSQEIARFCLADGVVEIRDDALVTDPRELAARLTPHRRRVSIESLLQRFEREIADDQTRQASVVRKLLRAEPTGSLLEELTDRETGLFDGVYAAMKLDEEFKRAMRFHQPLSLVLLDIGLDGSLPTEDAVRRTLLAEVAGVFLNECRDIDILARFTATTFLFLLPGTGTEGASVVTRRMLANLRDGKFQAGLQLRPFAGLVSVPAAGVATREAFLVRAEACLLLAKEGDAQDGLCADRD